MDYIGTPEVSIPKLDQSFWAVTGNARKLAKEDQLDLKPAKIESHLSYSQSMREYSAKSSTYIVALSRFDSSGFFSLVTTLRT
jgi:hypothetical protein